MKPTFVRVGVPKSKTRAPLTVRPPTEGGSPASALSNTRCFSDGTLTSDTHSWLIPSGRVSGDIIFAFIMTYNSTPNAAAISSVPSGYTLLDTQHDTTGNDNYCYVYYKVSDGTETDTTFSTTSPARVAAVFGRIPANGSTLTTPDINSVANPIVDTATINPPAVTPAAGAGTYHIISVLMGAKGGPDPDADSAVSTGYTNVIDCDAGGGVITSRVVVQQKASTAVVTTEDPDNYDWTATTGSRWFGCFTIAVQVTTADPAVVGYPVTASDIDSEAATDGQVLTADGAGNAAWEDVSGGVTNGDAHDHSGGDGAQIDHGGLAGLTDDDHTQYLNVARHDADDHSGLSLAASDLTTRYEVLVYDDGSGLEALANEAGTDWLYVEV